MMKLFPKLRKEDEYKPVHPF